MNTRQFQPNEQTSRRAAELFNENQFSVFRGADRLFALLLPVQWFGIMAAAYFYASPDETSAGGGLPEAVVMAVAAGAVITLLPLFLIFLYPGRAAARWTVAVCQMVMSVLLIDSTGGLTETHFHIFISLALLSFYRDWRILIPAGAIVAGEHLLDFALSPASSYGFVITGELTNIGHLGWAALEIGFLIINCRRGLSEMQMIAVRTAALEAGEERYRSIVEQTVEGIALIDPETMRVIECNLAFSTLLGCESIDQAKNLTTHDFNTGEKWEIEYVVDSTGTLGSAFSGEKSYRRRDGSVVPVEVNIKLISFDGKHAFCISTKDISERKKVEAELYRFALVLQKTQNTVILTDANGCIEWVNEGFTQLTGYQPEEVIGMLGYMLQGEETNAETVESIRTTMWARKPYTGEIYSYTKEGRGFWMSVSITPIRDQSGEIQGFIAVHMDITDRKTMEHDLRTAHTQLEQRVAERTAELVRANEALQIEVNERERAQAELGRAQQFLRAVIDNVPNMIFVKDAKGHYTLANLAKARLYNTSIENLIGKTDADFYDDKEKVRQMRADDYEVLAYLQEKVNYEEKFVDPNGKVRWLQIVKRPLIIGDPKAQHLLGIATDLTEQKLLEARLNHSRKLESIGQLAAGIAHEINTPTQYVGDNTRFIKSSFADIEAGIKSYKKLLEAVRLLPETPAICAQVEHEIEDLDLDYLMVEIPRAVDQALEGVSRIGKIISSMRTFSHPGTVEKIASDLNQAIESTISVAANEWKYIARLETDFDVDLPPVPCLLDEVNQVILNMIINATHAIKDVVGDGSAGKGIITISTRKIENAWAEVRIGDTGSGIPDEVQNRIFDPFFTTKEIGQGTGQGLAISHSVIVEKHGGQIDFETTPGLGTTFIIRLPLIENSIMLRR